MWCGLLHGQREACLQSLLPLYPLSTYSWCVCFHTLRPSEVFIYIRKSASPFVHVLHYSSQSLTWTDPDAIFTNSEPESPWKEWRCKSCLGLVGSENPSQSKWSLRGAHFRRNAKGLIENWHFIKPTGHMFYDTRMLDVNDGLPKWEGFAGSSRRLDSEVKE